MKLIDKDKVISMLQDKIADIKLDMKCGFLEKRKGTEKILVLKHIISLVNTLEVKEVDLEKECDNWRHNHFHGRRDKEASGEYLERSSQLDLAKHFFGLGLKAQKGE